MLLVDPLAARLVWLVAPYRWVTPNRLSLAALLVGLGSAACFATADRAWLAVGALLFHLSFVLDCMDGKIARLKGTGTIFGAWLDYLLDRVRVVVCAVALFGAQYAQTRNVWFVVVGGGIAFLDAVHHVNALEMARLRIVMSQQLAAAQDRLVQAGTAQVADRPAADVAPAVVSAQPGRDDRDVLPADDGGPDPELVADPKPDFRFSSGPYKMIRGRLLAGRIRMNLISTIELHMAVFIVAPLTGAFFSVPIVVGALLILFDLAKSCSFYLNTRRFTRRLSVAERKAAEAEAAAGDPAPAGADVSARLGMADAS